MTAVHHLSTKTATVREAVAKELIAHGEFSSSQNKNYPNALLAADEVIKIVLAHTTNAKLSCGAESNRHGGAVGAEKRAEQSNPGGGHEVTEHDAKKPYERKPAGMIPRPAGELLPCPFCGSQKVAHCLSKPNEKSRWVVEVVCQECGVRQPDCETEAEAVATWNQRVTQPPAPAQAASEPIAERLVDWTYLHATEGQQWPSTKTKSMLIARAMQGEPTQEHADGMKAAAPQPLDPAYARPIPVMPELTAEQEAELRKAMKQPGHIVWLEPENKWQPIETAPKDGTRILLFQAPRGAFEGWWHKRWPEPEEYWMDDQDSEPAPTHWQRTLAIPSTNGGSAAK